MAPVQCVHELSTLLQVKNTFIHFKPAWNDDEDDPVSSWFRQTSEPWTTRTKDLNKEGNCLIDIVDDCKAVLTPLTRDQISKDPKLEDPFCFSGQESDDSLAEQTASDAEDCNNEYKDVLTPLARDRVSKKLKLADPFCFAPQASNKQQNVALDDHKPNATYAIYARPDLEEAPKASPQNESSTDVKAVSLQEQSNLSQQGSNPQSFALEQNMVSQPFMLASPMMPPTMWNPFLGMHPSWCADSAMTIPAPIKTPTASKSKMPSYRKDRRANSLITLAAEAQGKLPQRQKQKAMVRFCPNCGEQVEKNFKFCQYCGNDVTRLDW
jgi:hypothetical protein